MVWDEKNQKQVVLLTNHHKLTASIVADIYKDRWEIELSFKAFKQNFKVKSFVGTSSNAVENPDLDSLDRPALAQMASPSFPGRMVTVQPGRHAAPTSLHIQGVARLAPTPLSHPVPQARTGPVTALALTWAGNRQ
ncbi:hypothetical protein DFAR_1900004 [Desulfarculales bacterium]